MLDNLVTQRNAAIGVSAGKLVWEGAVVFTYATHRCTLGSWGTLAASEKTTLQNRL